MEITENNSSKRLIWTYLIGIVFIIAIVFLVFWIYKSNPANQEQSSVMGGSPEPSDIAALQTQGTSDEVSAISQDLKATDLNSFSSDLSGFDTAIK